MRLQTQLPFRSLQALRYAQRNILLLLRPIHRLQIKVRKVQLL